MIIINIENIINECCFQDSLMNRKIRRTDTFISQICNKLLKIDCKT